MSFHRLRAARASSPAVVDETGRAVSYAELDERTERAAAALRARGERRVGALFFSNRLAGVVAYLAALRAGHVPILLPDGMPEPLRRTLLAEYAPDWIMGEAVGDEPLPGSGIGVRWEGGGERHLPPHPELGLLLCTSGTTGSLRLVRLTLAAMQANAESIAGYLGIDDGERTVTTLPPSYSYGLSVLNSHLLAGGCVVLNEHSVLSREFWALCGHHRPTSLAGVPATHQMMQRAGIGRMELPSLRTLTQAGGALGEKLAQSLCAMAVDRGWRFYSMYGQTEAAARISYVPPERLADKPGSIGVAIPGGELAIGAGGELVYRGPNVMMGYAAGRTDLSRGDELGGVLHTGDLGHRDDDGFFYVDGRLKRFVKLAGNRVGLDEVERRLERELELEVAAGGADGCLVVWVETDDGSQTARAESCVREAFGLHRSLFRVRCVPRLPSLANGKRDYRPLLEAL